MTTHFWRDPALPYAESRRACDSRACYRAHSHETYSIGAVDAGCSHFSGAAAQAVRLQAGSVVMVPAGRVHACNPEPGQSWSYQMLHLDAAWLAAVAEPGNSVKVLHDGWAYQRFCAANELLFSDAPAAIKESALIELVGDLHSLAGEELPGLAPAADLTAVKQALLADATPSLSTLAQLAGLSRYQLIRAFRQATGLPPHAWLLDQRINQARKRLRAGNALADVALELGFADQAHFQRLFKAHAAITPGAYRKA